MAKKKTTTTFTAQVRVNAVVDVDIEAETMEDAFTQAKALTMGDVLTLEENVVENDHRIKVVGMFGGEWGMD